VLITAETGRALKVLRSKLPDDIQPLCVSLLGQGGDAFAELNSTVQGITTRFAAWSPGAHDDRVAEIDREMDSARRALAKIDTELRSLREEETYPHSLMNGPMQGALQPSLSVWPASASALVGCRCRGKRPTIPP
jgi:hypothetical protein